MSIVDFHNHLMPAVDDGAQSIGDSCDGLSALARDGVTAIITTPHFDGSLTLDRLGAAQRLAELDTAWTTLSEHVRNHHPDLRVERGVELMLDTPEPDVHDTRLRLAGGRFVLLEFPFMAVPPRSVDVIAALARRDCVPIIAHPERYAGFPHDCSLAEQWKKKGAYLQVNGGSLLGKYGPNARRIAHDLLELGWVDYLSSDFHARGRPWVADYRQLLGELGAAEHCQLLTETNPARILSGETPVPLPPFRVKRSLWRRVSELFQS